VTDFRKKKRSKSAWKWRALTG